MLPLPITHRWLRARWLEASLVGGACLALACGNESDGADPASGGAATGGAATGGAGGACAAGQLPCAGLCTPVLTDAQNCGTCGVACAAGQSCAAGTCTGGSVWGSGGGGTGGVGTGGLSTGGLSTGGLSTGGSTGGIGGVATGGVGGGTGGMATGGWATGGWVTGGAETGGVATGGVPTGGAETGGWVTGGAETGGVPTGGVATGGVVTGGASTGGVATGGVATGGVATGGSAGELCDVGVWNGSAPQPLTLSGNTFAHDPTMIEANGVFYRFWTGNYIPSATSTNLTNWSNAPTVMGNSYPSWVDPWLSGISGETFNFPWAPDVSYFNGQYHIYSSFSAIFGDNISCITHLTTSNIAAGGWTDHGPVICTNGSENYNAIDADAGTDAAGNAYLAFGSFWNGIEMIPLNADGSRSGNTMTRLAWANQIEAPVLFRRCGYYYLFVTWGLCCPGEGRSVDQLTYRVAVGRSTNILGPYVDKNGTEMLDGGGTLLVQGDDVTWAAAGHSDVMVSGDKIYHLYHAYRQSDGGAQLRIVELPFDADGWPVPGGP